MELWRVNINPDELMLNMFDVNIEKELGGDKMSVTMKISSWFPNELNEKYLHIIVELPEYRINFKSCTDRKEPVPMDKVIFKEGFFELEAKNLLEEQPQRKLNVVYERKHHHKVPLQKFIGVMKCPQCLQDDEEERALFIDYDVVIPFHRNYHEKLVHGISIGNLKSPNKNACTISLLIRMKKKSKENFKGFTLLLQNMDQCRLKGCASVTKYTCINTDANNHLIDYAICRLINDHRVSINPNTPFGSGIIVEDLSYVGSNSYKKIYVKKSGTTVVAEDIMTDEWSSDHHLVLQEILVLPIFDENYRLLGILHGGNEQACYMVPIEIIKELIIK
ncbi:11809_t:CDS:2 [Funneliformis geosporum]|nr:11809_t:CDS:2 [Funneliformis geosporum]